MYGCKKFLCTAVRGWFFVGGWCGHEQSLLIHDDLVMSRGAAYLTRMMTAAAAVIYCTNHTAYTTDGLLFP